MLLKKSGISPRITSANNPILAAGDPLCPCPHGINAANPGNKINRGRDIGLCKIVKQREQAQHDRPDDQNSCLKN